MSRIKHAASVIVFRDGATGPAVLLVRRAPEMRFFGGYWVFPGGNVDDTDRGEDGVIDDAAFRRCAARELREETALEATGLEAVCRITTPPFYPVRFETWFYTTRVAADAVPVLAAAELVEHGFFDAGAVVRAWERGAMEIAPPVLFLLREIARHGPAGFIAAAAQRAATFDGAGLHPAYFAPGVFVAPLRTPTLPPATTTNTVIVGTSHLFIIDPATPDPAEQSRLFHQLDLMVAEGARIQAILLTHHHDDHVGAVVATSRRYRLPVRAHPLTFGRVPGDYLRGPPLADGDVIDLGSAPDGTPGWQLSVLHTPGHAVDHLCFVDNRYHAAVVGDMLSTISTILIDPPEGHMRTYLASLRRLLETPMTTLIPAHGLAHRDGHRLVREYLEHRRMREEQALSALTPVPQPVEALVPRIYTGTPEELYPLAARSLLAELIKLQEDGRCEETGTGWRLVA